MAYYDSFTKKPQSKRDDWRDDEMTRRPARDGGRAVEPEYREKKNYGDRKPYGERREYGDRKPYGERKFERREDRPYGEKPSFGGPRPERRERFEREDRPQRPERFDRDDRRPPREQRPVHVRSECA